MQRFNCKKIYCETIQLFNSILNELAVSDLHVSTMTVVLRPEMNDQSRHVQINETARNQRNLRKIHRHENPVASIEHAHVNLSIIYVTTHEQKSTHQYVILQQNTQKTTSCKSFRSCQVYNFRQKAKKLKT